MGIQFDATSSTAPTGGHADRPASVLLIELRLGERFPDVCSERIRTCVDEASATTAAPGIPRFRPTHRRSTAMRPPRAHRVVSRAGRIR
jgi:hypothetical protein